MLVNIETDCAKSIDLLLTVHLQTAFAAFKNEQVSNPDIGLYCDC
jgi:hypothetical protein